MPICLELPNVKTFSPPLTEGAIRLPSGNGITRGIDLIGTRGIDGIVVEKEPSPKLGPGRLPSVAVISRSLPPRKTVNRT